MKAQEAIEQTRAVIRRQHKAMATEESYLHWLRRFMEAVRQMPRELTSEKKFIKDARKKILVMT